MQSYIEGVEEIYQFIQQKEFDLAIKKVDNLLLEWKGNADLYIIKASLLQLTDYGDLEEIKNLYVTALNLSCLEWNSYVEFSLFCRNVLNDEEKYKEIKTEILNYVINSLKED